MMYLWRFDTDKHCKAGEVSRVTDVVRLSQIYQRNSLIGPPTVKQLPDLDHIPLHGIPF